MKILDIPQSGSVGAVTSSHNRSGQYRRQRSMPTQPRTTAQINARSRLTTQSAAWRGLTDAQRAAWASFANSFTVVNSLGAAIQLTGHQCFVKVNTTNLVNGDSVVTSPPALPAFVACTVTGLTATAGTPVFTIQGTTPAGTTKYQIYASPQLSAGVSYNNNFRLITVGTTFTTGNLDIKTAYVTKFGAVIAGKRIFVKVVQSQAGMQDNGTLFSVIVAT
jgi:hypothetical protein